MSFSLFFRKIKFLFKWAPSFSSGTSTAATQRDIIRLLSQIRPQVFLISLSNVSQNIHSKRFPNFVTPGFIFWHSVCLKSRSFCGKPIVFKIFNFSKCPSRHQNLFLWANRVRKPSTRIESSCGTTSSKRILQRHSLALLCYWATEQCSNSFIRILS